MKTLWQRITGETPVFFKNLQKLGLGLSALGTGLTQIPSFQSSIPTELITIGAVMAVVSQFAVQQVSPTENK